MKKSIIAATVIFLLTVTQQSYSQGRNHQGFYLSMQAGPAMGNINGNLNHQTSLKIEGTGIGLDAQIGGAISENLILHGVVGVKSIIGPTISVGGTMNQKTTVSDDYSFDEVMIGIGTTYYFKGNYFLTGNVGLGNFSFSDESTKTTVDTDNGFSFQLKAGREFWVSPRWALGVVLEYGGTRTDDQVDNVSESWESHRFSVRFVATLNGKK